MNRAWNGKNLGVLGGMGPAAAAEFLRLLALYSPAETDQQHPVVYMIGDTQIPDRSSAILGKGASPLGRIRQDLEKLIELGADILTCPCNSAHYFIDQIDQSLAKPLVHIVEATILAAQATSPDGAWMLSTLGTRQSGLYQKYADKHGYKLYIPTEIQAQQAQECIDFIKANDFVQAAKVMENLVRGLWQERDILIMTACTELPLAYGVSTLPKDREVSSLKALAKACVAELFTGTSS